LVIAGSNGHIAWGYTNSNGDWSDAVRVRPGAIPGTYRTPDGDLPIALYQEQIAVKNSEPVELEVRETIWGPIDDDSIIRDSEIAISWVAHHTDATNLGIMQLETAQTVAAALDIANRIVMPPQNFVVGDIHGDIGWTISGLIPSRGDFDPGQPADWSEQHGWQGWLAAADYPRILNPPSGRIWTANARVVDGDALRLLGDSGYEFGARARQIRDALFARDVFAPRDMLQIQDDDRALYLAEWQALLVQVLEQQDPGDPDLTEYQRLVANWIPRAVPESVGYRLVRAFRIEVRQRMWDALMAPVRQVYGDEIRLTSSRQFDAPLWSIINERPAHLLPANYATWDDFLLEAVRAARAGLLQSTPGELADRTWGEYNTASIHHPVSAAVPWLSAWLDMPADPLRGDSNMPRAQGPDWGASERFSISPGDEANSLLHMPGGQSGHPLSSYYRSGHAAWVNGEPTPFLPGPAEYELILRPATR
jgi:penicillin amidase